MTLEGSVLGRINETATQSQGLNFGAVQLPFFPLLLWNSSAFSGALRLSFSLSFFSLFSISWHIVFFNLLDWQDCR